MIKQDNIPLTIHVLFLESRRSVISQMMELETHCTERVSGGFTVYNERVVVLLYREISLCCYGDEPHTALHENTAYTYIFKIISDISIL